MYLPRIGKLFAKCVSFSAHCCNYLLETTQITLEQDKRNVAKYFKESLYHKAPSLMNSPLCFHHFSNSRGQFNYVIR